MRTGARRLMLLLGLLVLTESCLFQNEPLKPNSSPYIVSVNPEVYDIDLNAPLDTVTLRITGGDPDYDQLRYRFVLIDTATGGIDSVYCNTNRFRFEARKGGFYRVQGRVYDNEHYVSRDWYIRVFQEANERPPVIIGYVPDTDSISCVIGNTMEFRLSVDDDNLATCLYTFLVDDVVDPYYRFIRTPRFLHRFGENGIFKVTGLVWDGEYGDTMNWYVKVIGDPDLIPPSAITDLEGWTGMDAGTVNLQWTAPGDDGEEGRCSIYRVRTFTIPILTEEDWLEASPKNGAPEPGVSGTPETMVIDKLNPGTNMYVVVRGMDDFGNLGPISNCIRLLVRGFDADGYVRDAASFLPLEDMVVSSSGVVDSTDENGYYLLKNLPMYADFTRVRDEKISGEPGNYYDYENPMNGMNDNLTIDYLLVPVLGMADLVIKTSYDNGNFLNFFKNMAGITGKFGMPTIFRGWNHWPLKVFNPQREWEGMDIDSLAQVGMDCWEAATGLVLFEGVATPEEADVQIVYYETEQDNHYFITTEVNPDGTPKKREIRIFLTNHLSPITIIGKMIFAHELGHVMGLGHSLDTGHLMLGFTSPWVDEPSSDEANLIKVIYHQPAIFDGANILDD
ncbi:MAG: hypothetical protein JXB45_05675 [Candidatus Krumholzibacteriota bacterium]|nr:hypothetical protein [Candidatus Krumholzibacteriota bacterium]